MSVTQSPNSGDYGLDLPGSRAVRLSKSQLAPLEGIMLDRSQLPDTPLEDWGFEPVSTRDSAKELPTLSLVTDVSSRHDVDFLAPGGRRVGGFAFSDQHPDPWWNGVHSNGQVLVFVGDVSALLAAKDLGQQVAVMNNSHLGLSQLAVRAYKDGVGTAAPGQ